MAKFSALSLRRLEPVHPLLQRLAHVLVRDHHDCSVIYGARTQEEHRALFQAGLSKTMNSKHLIQPDGWAHAIDLTPYPIDWNDTKRFYWFAGMARAVSRMTFPVGVRIRGGWNWDMDEDLNDQTFMDLIHIELRFEKDTI